MSYFQTCKKIIYTGGLLSVGFLVGCGGGGGGGGGKAPTIVNQAPTVSIVGSNRATERDIATFTANAEDIDGSIVSYEWSIDSTDIELNGADSNEVTFTAPDVREKAEYTVTLTVTDDGGLSDTTSTLFTAVPIKKEIEIYGQVIDEEIVYADVTFEIGDETFNVAANALGQYVIEMEVDEVNFDQLIKITALGTIEAQKNVKLVSLLESFNTVYNQLNSIDIITIVENFAVNVTNLTTAKYIVAQEINNGVEVTDEATYNDIYPNLYQTSHERMLEIAAVIKAVVDVRNEYANHHLSENVSDTYELIFNAEEYAIALNALIADGSLYGDTIIEIVSDANISEYPDFDNDGIFDTLDDDIDGDGYKNIVKDKTGRDPEFQDVERDSLEFDYHPYDASLHSPFVSHLILEDFDEESSSNLANSLVGCLRAIARRDEHISANYEVATGYWQPLNVPVSEFTNINCPDYKNYGDLSSALKYFTNVTSVDFTSASNLSGLEVLQTLPITRLILNANTATSTLADASKNHDFSFLQNMPSITELDLSGSTFNNVDFLANMTQLAKLNLKGTAINNINGLSDLAELTQVDISVTGVADLSPLNNATKLSSLKASQSKVVTLPDFSVMPQLSVLEINDNNIVDISSISSLTNFTELDLRNNSIADISPLENLTSLTLLNISNNNVAGDLNDLTLLTSLQVLAFDDNQINDITGVSGMIQLDELMISNNALTGSTVLTPLAQLVNLSYLDLEDNQISNIDTLLNWQTLPATVKLRNNTLICEQQTAIFTKAEEQGSVVTVGNDDAEVQCIEEEEFIIETGGPFGVEHEGEFIPARTPLEVLSLSSQLAGISGPGHSVLGLTDMIFCISRNDQSIYPICFESNHSLTNNHQISCKAEANSLQVECTMPDTIKVGETGDDPAHHWPGVAFTWDFEQRVVPGNKFAATFEDRVILQLLKSQASDLDMDFTCSQLIDGMSTCTISSNDNDHPNSNFIGSISWQQPHTKPYFPRCSGNAGDTIAICYPAHEIVIPREDGNVDKSAPSFTLDMTEITIKPLGEDSCSGICD